MTNVNTKHHCEPSLTFCLIDVWIWVRMSEVRSVVSPGYGHLRLPIRELILYMKNVTYVIKLIECLTDRHYRFYRI